MTMKLPPAWASNTNYSAGPDTGTPTKVDPASQANGYIRGVAAAAQTVNFVINPIADAARRAFLLAACKLRRITLEGTAITDTAESMAAVQRNVGTPLLAIKTAQALGLGDADRFVVQGVPSQITSLVAAAATDGTNIVVLGTGGNNATVSTDDGATWATGTNGLAEADATARIIWSEANSLFYSGPRTLGGGFESIARSVDGTGASAANTTIANGNVFAGLAALADAKIVACFDQSGDPAFQVSPGSSSAFTDTGGTVANPTLFDEGGCLVGNGGTTIYHAGRISTGTSIQVSSSVDGAAWTTTASLSPPGSSAFASRPRLFMCQNTGLLVIVAPTTSNQTAVYASLDGVDWAGPLVVFPDPGVNAFAVAGGRLLMTHDDMLFASDGIGF